MSHFTRVMVRLPARSMIGIIIIDRTVDRKHLPGSVRIMDTCVRGLVGNNTL